MEIAKNKHVLGTDEDHVHFLIQSIPTESPKSIIQKIKSITAREIFKQNPEARRMLWGGKFWTKDYAKNQTKNYAKIHESQLTLFD